MGNLFALSSAAPNLDYLEDTSALRLVLEYYDREHAALVRYLCFLNVNPETAKEIVQDCFVKLHEHLQAGGDAGNLRAWLYRVAHNLARNSQLSARARKTEAQRQAILLRSQGLKYREIAQALSLSISTVAENVQRGMDMLRKIVA
jgi:RNA polymerase sigma-70 factor (ECF subfamily)